MNDETRRLAGKRMRRAVLGAAHVDRAAARATAFSAEFQDLLTRFAWGEIWARPGFDPRTRRLLVIATLVALSRWDELAMHARAALESGDLSADDLKEVLLQQAVYCGIPAANSAFEAVREVVAAHVASVRRGRARGASPTPARSRKRSSRRQ